MASHDDDSRDVLLAYRARHAPPARSAADNWQQLLRRIDAGEPAPALGPVEAPARTGSSSARTWAFGLLAAAAAALLAARLVWPDSFSARGRDAGAAAPYQHQPDARPQAVEVAGPPSAAASRPVPSDISPEPPAPVPALQRPVSPSMPEKTGPEADLARELAAVRAAAQAVRDGDGATALRRADEYLSAHPRGSLVPEARLRRLEALCLLGRGDEARREADAFLADYPQSPLRERAAAACKSSHDSGEPRP
ncbi:hypothetical protein OV079_46690 [Nannocystis pusilla]|uniref:Outer membrane lipoprotein BamD-like domain-containing protein n=1 Tax=Nannocystis pusilla TaxID=889268 RepID=A0A9X3F0A8_9BACT|nr:hypothetical protein [Nannocystis pusilla]MCY1012905.1 hypothetical protein [Nannocystis pusilla]